MSLPKSIRDEHKEKKELSRLGNKPESNLKKVEDKKKQKNGKK